MRACCTTKFCWLFAFALMTSHQGVLALDDLLTTAEGSGEEGSGEDPLISLPDETNLSTDRPIPQLEQIELGSMMNDDAKPSASKCRSNDADIVFALDASGSLAANYAKHVNWTRQLVESLFARASPSTVRVALVQYTERPRTEITLKNGDQQQHIIERLNLWRSIAPGRTRTGSALKSVEIELYNERHGARRNAAKIIVLYTDGMSEDDPVKHAKTLREKRGAKIFVVSVGSDGSESGITRIAGDERNVFKTTEFTRLQKALIDEVCNEPTTPDKASTTAEPIFTRKVVQNVKKVAGKYKSQKPGSATKLENNAETVDPILAQITQTTEQSEETTGQSNGTTNAAEQTSNDATKQTEETQTDGPDVYNFDQQTNETSWQTDQATSPTNETTDQTDGTTGGTELTTKDASDQIEQTTNDTSDQTEQTTKGDQTEQTTNDTSDQTEQTTKGDQTEQIMNDTSDQTEQTTKGDQTEQTTNDTSDQTEQKPTQTDSTPSIGTQSTSDVEQNEKEVSGKADIARTSRPPVAQTKLNIKPKKKLVQKTSKVNKAAAAADPASSSLPSKNSVSTTVRASTSTVKPERRPGPHCAQDILFVVDSSSSVQQIYDQQKEFLRSILGEIQIGEDDQRVALIQFTGEMHQRVEWTFETLTDSKQIAAAFERIHHIHGITFIGRALVKSLTLLNTRRTNVPTTVVLISDGFSQDDATKPAEDIRNLPNVNFYALSIAELNNSDYLANLTDNPEKVYIGPRTEELKQRMIKSFRCQA